MPLARRRLGRTDIAVPDLCLGTMTWGSQNSEAEGHAQMDRALAMGIDFFDTAEMYAVPPAAETYGRTEEIIGSWFRTRPGARQRVILATKVIGKAPQAKWVREGRTRLDRPNITAALEDSLRRLGTDWIDLYQIHFPDRPTNRFGQLDYRHQPDPEAVPLEETLGVLADLVTAGKVRAIGISNETPWGAMTYLKAADSGDGPRLASIQNVYNLLNRSYEIGLSEISLREDLSLLAYSPLAGGTLTGKYLDGALPPGTRRAVDSRRSRYDTRRGEEATRRYVEVARRHGIDPAPMAIAFCRSRDFVTSTIIGATSMAQLETDLQALDLVLSEELLAELDAVHADIPNPCP